ncbi:MAG: metal ABC transporter permease [Pseudomonadota bacterium]
MSHLELFINALTLQSGYNTALVTIGTALLGLAAGGVGTFVFLRKRALISDAIAHACLPGIGLAFIAMVYLGGDGRLLPGLLLGATASALCGVVLMQWIVTKTRLSEDAAIGAVLSVFFGFGVVILTIIQNIPIGRQAGLETFLLGSTAGMLYSEALTIASIAALCAIIIFMFHYAMISVAFDPHHAATSGISINRTDLLMMTLALIITVVSLKIVGLVLSVALLIIPPVTARLWTNRADRMVALAATLGALAGYLGACLSSIATNLPTGPIIVLLSFTIFLGSLILSPVRGLLAFVINQMTYTRKVHLRQGLLALARQETIYDRLTIKLLKQRKFIQGDGVITEAGQHAAQKALQDEARWALAQTLYKNDDPHTQYGALIPIEEVFTKDEIHQLDQHINGLKPS